MSRYTWSRLLFLILGLVAAALTLVPLTQDVPFLAFFLLVLPVVILLAVLGLAMFVGWQGGVFDSMNAVMKGTGSRFVDEDMQIASKAAPFGSIK